MNISITLETMAKTAQMQTPELLRNIDRWPKNHRGDYSLCLQPQKSFFLDNPNATKIPARLRIEMAPPIRNDSGSYV